MQTKSKKILLSIIGFSVLLIVVVSVYFKIVEKKETEYVWVDDSYDECVKVMTENFSTDIVLYGEPLSFRENVVYRYINILNDETLSTEKEYEFIIINDLNGTVNLTETDIEMLKKHVLKGSANFYYLGTENYNKLKENEFTRFDREQGEWGFNCEHKYGELVYGGGLWSSYDEEHSGELADVNLCNTILLSFVHYLKTCN